MKSPVPEVLNSSREPGRSHATAIGLLVIHHHAGDRPRRVLKDGLVLHRQSLDEGANPFSLPVVRFSGRVILPWRPARIGNG